MSRLILILGLLGVIGLTPAWARPDLDANRARRIAEPVPQAASRELPPAAGLSTSKAALSPSDAARQVQRRYGGRVLAVQQDGDGYRVKVLKDGEVRIYQVNP